MIASVCRSLFLVLVVLGLSAGPSVAADRDKMMVEPGVYGTFAVFRVDSSWWRLERSVRISGLAHAKGVVERHQARVAIDAYLMRGLSDQGDFMLRVHATDLQHTQDFLVEFMSTIFGQFATNTVTMKGVTKKPNYTAAFPDDVKSTLQTLSDPLPKPFTIVIPIRKDAEWWGLEPEQRGGLMKEHVEAATAYLKAVRRKVYHSKGLEDFDFLAYFETGKLEEFNDLMVSLEKVKESRYSRPVNHPVLIGVTKSLGEVLQVFGR